jgi:hypothetical protein
VGAYELPGEYEHRPRFVELRDVDRAHEARLVQIIQGDAGGELG